MTTVRHGDMRVSSLTDLILQKLLRVKQIEDNKGSTLISEGVDANYLDMLKLCCICSNKIKKIIMKDLIKKVYESPAFVWFLRVLISALFFVSAVAKMYPSPEIGLIKYFEIKQLVQGLGFNEILAQYFSRSIIAFEFFIAISVLLNNYLKRIIYPISILPLVAFTTHLTYLVFQGNDGNCGCFGELIQ